MLPSRRCGHRRLLAPAMGGSSLAMTCSASARRRRTVVIALALLAGVSVVYLRLWAIDSGFSSSEDRDFLRKQFDRVNMEAMEESAEWRMKYDAEVERSRQHKEEAKQANEAITTARETIASLQKENKNLNVQLTSLRHDIEILRQNCACTLPSKGS